MTPSPATVAAMSDDALMDLAQKMTLSYFWDYGHPTSGMARERDNNAFGYTLTIVLPIIALARRQAERRWLRRVLQR